MGEDSQSGKSGWAGQWDRHRWKVSVATRQSAGAKEQPVAESSDRRLRSLDEFERPEWLPTMNFKANEKSVFSWAELRLMLLVGVFAGLVYAAGAAGVWG